MGDAYTWVKDDRQDLGQDQDDKGTSQRSRRAAQPQYPSERHAGQHQPGPGGPHPSKGFGFGWVRAGGWFAV